MPVTHFITHQINKEAQKSAAVVTVSASEAEVDDYCHLVMSQLKGILVQRASRRYGCFNPEVTLVKNLTLDWLNNQQDFLSWTSKVSERFAEMMDNTELEMDGYLAFASEELAGNNKLYIFHLREKSNLCLTADMQLSDSRVLDFSNTGFGLCIDTSALKIEQDEEQKEEKYFTFSFGRGDKAIQKLFSDFTGFIDTLDTEQETQEFLQIVEEYTQTLPESESAETKTRVIEYCMEQDKKGEAVAFKTLSGQLDNNAPEKFEQFVALKKHERRQARPLSATSTNDDASSTELADGETVIKTELIPDRKSLKNYLRYSGKNKELTLSFAATALGTDISFDNNENSLTIKNLPGRLLKQLKPDNN